eukprot:6467933-Pyramimonas_sp.AAC.1
MPGLPSSPGVRHCRAYILLLSRVRIGPDRVRIERLQSTRGRSPRTPPANPETGRVLLLY